ncbi:hypothetical protein [Chitinophaga pinensis]|uniref:Uncharacterized protein n=1 Tax=Chitinophaga pinensis (strain ATCC 43595 / DSM 2588 / LMG 13176 / NBRC 15968 / NCIMB 11800 / UQM 2034) TaxID=485918 RepID=A0A979G5R8_CHIPD|nr:hypothetical protein [Chitinophaga pinensis]ACU61349.1 hypothetical protein Cpin_3887 [Chitinophaga pinensis DSM 2588]
MTEQLNWDSEIAMLLESGFELNLSPDQDDGYPVEILNEGDVVFYHKSWTRQNIAVMLHGISEGDYQKNFSVYVRQNIGCGWLLMPYLWSRLEYWFLELLKLSLDGCGLKGARI